MSLKGVELDYEIETAGVPLCMTLYQNNGGDDGNDIVYGTVDGKIALVRVKP